MLPNSIRSFLDQKKGLQIENEQPVSGGSINHAVKLETSNGVYFLKWNASAPDGFFEKESKGLQLLNSAAMEIRIPEVITTHDGSKEVPAFVLMEYIEEGASGNSHLFGAELARLHQNHANQFGLDEDNYIGKLPQSNRWHNDWVSFFVNERIQPQLKSAIDQRHVSATLAANWNRLANRLHSIFLPCEPSLVHGDLWSGNYLFDKTGTAVLIDPAVYYGHPEMDLAFSKMFGGFSPDFYTGYQEVQPLESGFAERVDIYNFYPLLVHVNLFGGGYAGQAERFLNRY